MFAQRISRVHFSLAVLGQAILGRDACQQHLAITNTLFHFVIELVTTLHDVAIEPAAVALTGQVLVELDDLRLFAPVVGDEDLGFCGALLGTLLRLLHH